MRIHGGLCKRLVGRDMHRRDICSADGIKRNPDDVLDDWIEIDIRAVDRHAGADIRRSARNGRPTDQRFSGGKLKLCNIGRGYKIVGIRRTRLDDGAELVMEKDIIGRNKLRGQRGRSVLRNCLNAKGIE